MKADLLKQVGFHFLLVFRYLLALRSLKLSMQLKLRYIIFTH